MAPILPYGARRLSLHLRGWLSMAKGPVPVSQWHVLAVTHRGAHLQRSIPLESTARSFEPLSALASSPRVGVWAGGKQPLCRQGRRQVSPLLQRFPRSTGGLRIQRTGLHRGSRGGPYSGPIRTPRKTIDFTRSQSPIAEPGRRCHKSAESIGRFCRLSKRHLSG